MSGEAGPDGGMDWRAPRLAWVATLLTERFGREILLEASGDGIALRLAGIEGEIRFPANCMLAYMDVSHDPGCGTWVPSREQFFPSIDDQLPAPGANVLPCPVVESAPWGHSIHYDIPGLVYWMLSRQEELRKVGLDGHGRFPARESHAFRHGYLERPIVDEWLAILAQIMERTWPGLELRASAPSMAVSHDVDSPSRFGFLAPHQLLRTIAAELVRSRRLSLVYKAPRIWAAARSDLAEDDPSNVFDWIMRLSEERGLVSTFYFICGTTDPKKDARYRISDPAIRKLMRRISARGHRIGLHPSYGTFLDPAALAAEFSHLREVCAQEGVSQDTWGARMHFLRWRTPTTPRGLAAAGLDYDNSLGYADMPGFRCGTCHEYGAFDPVVGVPIPLRIRPLVAMECTVMAKRYLGLGTSEAAYERFARLRDACRSVGGCFSILWHNTELVAQDKRDLYRSLLPSA